MKTIAINVPKEGVCIELMLVGDASQAEALLSLPDNVIIRPPPIRHTLLGETVLEPDRYGWAAELAKSSVTFFGHALKIQIETSVLTKTQEPPTPSRAELNLATMILQNLETLVATCQTKFTEENPSFDSTAQKHIINPHFWISREFLGEGAHWEFVIGRDDAPDFSYHLEFDCLNYLGMSAGD